MIDQKFGFSKKVTSKILDADTFLNQMEKALKGKKLVMCHGTFDLVHPGHLRHLAYAKSKGDILLVSLTADSFVQKANNRPYVPEDLRALNLAALELVDFVIIDNNSEPLNILEKIKPDFYVKGFEYGNEKLPPKTIEEKKIVENFGGEILFSPGDFVLSSSAVIENNPPNLAVEKLLILLQAENLTFKDLQNSLDNLHNISIDVVGDLIVDGLTNSTVIGGHRKTPTPSVKIKSVERFVGGAGIVAKHLRASGANVNLFSILGDDELGKFALRDLSESGINTLIQIDKSRPTTYKNAIMTDGYKLIRIDEVSNSSINSDQLNNFCLNLKNSPSDAVVLSDFRHGIFNKSTIKDLLNSIPKEKFKVADSQVASRWGNILDFVDCDLLTPNEEEVRFALADQDTVIRPLGTELMRKSNCKILMLKLGERGILTFRTDKIAGEKPTFFAVDALVRDSIIDPVGAGDALLAYATVVMLKTQNEVIASIIGTIAAGLACQKEGNIPINPFEIKVYLNNIEKFVNFSKI